MPNKSLFLIALGATFLFPATAHAYLDPGTGNALIYIVISLFATLLYFCKSLFYGLRAKLSGGSRPLRNPAPRDDLVIFAEGKIYWPTFKPIVEALLARGFPFHYLSMDLEDPGLAMEHDLMRSRYIGEGSAALARAAAVRAAVMLETTPNIGAPGHPMPAPRHVRCLAHVLHGVGGVATYYKNALDTCHAVLLMGGEDHDSIRLLGKKRGLSAQECVAAGLPYLDTLARTVRPRESLADPPCILVAPSWGEKNCLGYCGTDFLPWLLEAGYRVIVRPHPFSLKAEAPFVEALRSLLAPYAAASLDLEMDGSASLNRADLMISDKSGVRFDFAFLRERPVITLNMPLKNRQRFEIDELDYVWADEMEAELGPVLSADDFRNLGASAFLALVAETLGMGPSRLAALRERNIANFGHSGEFIADWAISKCQALVTSKI
jgi:hypothetical protein